MDTNLLLTIVLGLIAFIGLKKMFEQRGPTTRPVDKELQNMIEAIRNSGPELAEKKRKYEEALRNLKSDSNNNSSPQ